MTIFTNIPDNVLEPGDPIRSVDIVALKDNAKYLYEKLDNVNVQTFNSSGTWTNPTLNGTQVGRLARIQVWGGGGGGSRSEIINEICGGAGGGYVEVTVPLSTLGSTVSVTIGSGGAGRTGSNGVGSNGGNSSFGSVATAYGGRGGTVNTGLAIGGNGHGVYTNDFSPSSDLVWNGGYGTPGIDTSRRIARSSVYGGGAGGCGPSIGDRQQGGVSQFGGNGGDASAAGTQPGGGGGGGNNPIVNGANGAAGRVIVTCF